MPPRFSTSPWTDEISAAARSLWETGTSATKIAIIMDTQHSVRMSRNAVIGRAWRGRWLNPNTHKSHFYDFYGQPREPRKPRVPRPNGVDGALMLKLQAQRKPPRFPTDDRKPTITEPIESRNMKLIELGPRDCRYPTSPDDATSHLFCGAPQYDDGPYCLHHAQICYRATPRMMSQVPPPHTSPTEDLPHGKTRSEHSGSSA